MPIVSIFENPKLAFGGSSRLALRLEARPVERTCLKAHGKVRTGLLSRITPLVGLMTPIKTCLLSPMIL